MKIRTGNNIEATLYSFDIFDTLITRRVYTPLGIFALMQEKLKTNSKYKDTFSDYFKNNFAVLRHKTEFWKRDNVFCNRTGAQDITFEQIYALLQKNQSLTDEQVRLLKELEIQTEKDNLVPISENVGIVKDLIKQKKEVILISDMYFSKEILHDIMTNIDPVFENIDIYVSADILKSKYFGDLYKYVKNKKGYIYNKWLHYDDSWHNIEKASELQIKTAFVEYGPASDFAPFVMSDLEKEFNVFYQAALGSSKLATKYRPESDDLFNFGAEYMGPILYGYTSWVLEQAQIKGLKHLYFVARDSYVPMLIAQKIASVKKMDIQIHYLYGSRAAWRFPTKENIIDHVKINFMEFSDRLTLNFLSDRLEIPTAKLQKYTKIKDPDKILTIKEARRLQANLLNNKAFLQELLSVHKEKEELLVGYLKQEIDFSKDDFAFVEINGSGRTQDYLQKITKKFYPKDLTTFFFHLTIDSSINESSNKISYFPLTTYNTFYLEIFCTNFDGKTIGYKKQGDIIVPVFGKVRQQLIQFGYQNCIDGVLAYTDKILAFEKANKLFVGDLWLYLKFWEYLNFAFSKKVANILGSFPYMVIGDEDKPCAPKYSWWDVVKFAITGKEKVYAVNHISIRRSGKMKRRIIEKIYKKGCLEKRVSKFLSSIFGIKNDYTAGKRKKVITVFGKHFKIDMTRPGICTDISYALTFLKFILKKKRKEKLTKIDKIRFITFREPLYKGGGGGQGAAMTMNKLILPPEFKGIPIEYTFEVPNKYCRERNAGPNVEFQGIQFAINETKHDKNVVYVTHEEATAFGLWLMGKNYVMFSHLQGARAEEHKNFGYKLSKLSVKIIKFCEAVAMKNAYFVCFVAEGAYKYFCNSKYRGLEKEDFRKGPIVYNTLYVENPPEQYMDLEYDKDYLTILTSGSLTVAKGVDRSLELVDRICAKTKRKIRYIFIGEGVLQNMVETKLYEMKQKYPHFSYITVGRCSDGNMPYLQSLCDVFVVLHRIAIFDLSTLEMMNKGKAIVLSDVGGNPEFNVENNILMWSEEKENYDEVADKILKADLAKLGKKNKEVYDKYFGHEPYIKSYENLLEDFISHVTKE